MVQAIDKQIAASGIELWSETDSDANENFADEAEQCNYQLQVRNDAGVGLANAVIPSLQQAAIKVKLTQVEASELLSSQLKSILVVKKNHLLTIKPLGEGTNTNCSLQTPIKPNVAADAELEETKTPVTAAKSPAIPVKKAKKSVCWDSNVPDKTEKEFMHAADDADSRTIQDGKALNDLDHSDEEDDVDEVDDQEQINPYKRIRT